MRGFRIRTCSQGARPGGQPPWADPPSMPVENPAAVNSSVRPRSRKRAVLWLVQGCGQVKLPKPPTEASAW